ncbi:MAG: DUF4097 family beta strand repeat-containing protein [Bacteroidota bacterium]
MKTNKICLFHDLFWTIVLMIAFSSILTAREDDDQKPVVKTNSFKVQKGGTLRMSVEAGDVRIIPWDKNEVAVKATSEDEDDFEDLNMDMHGNTLRIDNQSSCSSCEIRYEVNVPDEFDLDIETSEGNINIQSGLNGDIMGRTSAGNIKLGALGGTIDMKTSGGNITTDDIRGDLRLGTSGGNIVVGKVDGKCDVSTSGGDIRIANVGKTLDARTAGGDIRIGDVGGEANVSTSGGTIVVGKIGGRATLSTAGGDIEISSATGIVSAKTAGGNLRLENITGSVTAKTAGGDVEAELIPSGNGKSKLSTAAGEVKIYLPEDAKATINARIRFNGRWNNEDEYRIKSDFKSENYHTDEDEGEITATYILNGGGETITLETSNADIIIRKLIGGRKGGR